MTFIEAISSGFKKYIEFKGRASLSEYWWFSLFVVIVSIIGDLLDSSGVATLLLMTVTLIPHSAVGARRLHDTNRSGWWLLISLTVIGIIPMLIWLASKGSNKSNNYGEPISNSEVLNSANNFKIDSEKIKNLIKLMYCLGIKLLISLRVKLEIVACTQSCLLKPKGDESKVKARYIDIRAKEIHSNKI